MNTAQGNVRLSCVHESGESLSGKDHNSPNYKVWMHYLSNINGSFHRTTKMNLKIVWNHKIKQIAKVNLSK